MFKIKEFWVVVLPRCVETGCQKDGKYTLITLDAQVVKVCEDHLKLWLDSGAVLKQPFRAGLKGFLKRYFGPSIPFIVGLILVLFELNNVIGIYNLSPLFTLGLIILALSWIIMCAVLHKAYSIQKK